LYNVLCSIYSTTPTKKTKAEMAGTNVNLFIGKMTGFEIIHVMFSIKKYKSSDCDWEHIHKAKFMLYLEEICET
jgi:hypothetical protein